MIDFVALSGTSLGPEPRPSDQAAGWEPFAAVVAAALGVAAPSMSALPVQSVTDVGRHPVDDTSPLVAPAPVAAPWDPAAPVAHPDNTPPLRPSAGISRPEPAGLASSQPSGEGEPVGPPLMPETGSAEPAGCPPPEAPLHPVTSSPPVLAGGAATGPDITEAPVTQLAGGGELPQPLHSARLPLPGAAPSEEGVGAPPVAGVPQGPGLAEPLPTGRSDTGPAGEEDTTRAAGKAQAPFPSEALRPAATGESPGAVGSRPLETLPYEEPEPSSVDDAAGLRPTGNAVQDLSEVSPLGTDRSHDPVAGGPTEEARGAETLRRVIEWLDHALEAEPRQLTVELPDGEGWVRVAWSEGKVKVEVETATLSTWWLDELENALAERGFELHRDSGGGGQQRAEERPDFGPAPAPSKSKVGDIDGILL